MSLVARWIPVPFVSLVLIIGTAHAAPLPVERTGERLHAIALESFRQGRFPEAYGRLIALADALEMALCMPPVQQRARMFNMRQVVRRNNIYRWAGSMLSDAARVREADAHPSAAWREVA